MIEFTTHYTPSKEKFYDADEVDSLLSEVYDILVEITKREGAYSMDHLTHASNTINNMERLAREALAILENQSSTGKAN